jgi:hypothetical protein
MNSAEERRKKYPEFLKQVTCVNNLFQEFFEELKVAGLYDRAHIVVHGDHGSRLATHNLRARPFYRQGFRPSTETLVDYYPTLFAYKPPGGNAGEYRRELRSVAGLLKASLSGQLRSELPAEDRVVYLVEWDEERCDQAEADRVEGCRLLPFELPEFSREDIVERAQASSN